MDQITVPQFIDNEDKILGPITVRQFIIVLIAGIVIFLAYKLADFGAFIVIALVVGGSSATLAFYKVNGQPFHFFLLHILQTAKDPSLRVWKKDPQHSFFPTEHEVIEKDDATAPSHGHIAEQRLSQLSLVVDTGGAFHEDDDRGTELF